ncbi:MAG: DUF1214 domain-containing protein [Betaproteobacteria bacterium]|nr:DUF1214 domain-containing protein [Betaproteobacteria bacterium]
MMIPSGGISCKSFWSISVYQVEADGRLYFVQNGRRRYSIGNRSTDLMPEEDGQNRNMSAKLRSHLITRLSKTGCPRQVLSIPPCASSSGPICPQVI